MAVTQYTGARYVPLFADPADWTKERTYEPLTIVLHEGNSFTSKQFVPKGIELDNEDFWAETGNYNAQVEAYRQEVLQFDGRISANEQSIRTLTDDLSKNRSSLAYVGNHGATEKTLNIDWQGIIDEISNVSDTIDFGSGQWYIDSPIVIPKTIKRVSANGAILTAYGDIDYMVDISNLTYSDSQRFFVISGITFDANTNANICVRNIGAGNAAHIENCVFRNFNNYGVYSEALGASIYNSFFVNQENKNTGCGIYTYSDNVIIGCKFFYLEYGIACRSATNIMGCYFFTQHMTAPTYGICSTYFKDGALTQISKIYITACEFDCITRCISQMRNVVVDGCNFYWNGKDDTLSTDRSIFFSHGASIERTSLINSFFDISTDLPISGRVLTFNSDRVNAAFRAVRFNSYNCHTGMFQSDNEAYIAARDKIFISCGFIPNRNLTYMTNEDDFIGTKFIPQQGNTPITFLPTFCIKAVTEGAVFNHFHYVGSNQIIKNEPSHSTAIVKAYQNGANSDFVLSVPPQAITEVNFSDGPMFNMAWNQQSQKPNGYTEIESKYVQLSSSYPS